MTQKIFLSYKREDNKDGFVEKLYNALIDKGYDVWWDMESMPNRQLTFLTEIRDAVAGHDRLILVGSKLAYHSDYVKAEFEYALSVCKPVHLIMRADDYTDVPDSISQLDIPNFKDDANFDESVEHLLRHLEQDSAPLGDIHGTRPALPAWYIERDNIMGELDNKVLIDSKQPVVVTSKQQVSALHGMGGIGKTTVASAFTERCATRRYFPDGIFWIQLGKNPDITFQQSNIGKIFGDDPKEYLTPEKGLARLQALLSDKKVLFVLDDVWEKDHADAFRIQGNFTRTLITSRQQDLVVQIAAMLAEVDKLTIEEGLRLFDARLNRHADARKHEVIERQIIELLDGYTLAVELASAQLFKKGEDYAERLLDRLQKKRATDNPFSDIEIEGDGKNDNLEISLAISYEDLSEDEQHRFRVLGVLAPNAPFSYELMQPLYGDEDDSVTEDNLDTLQNMALVGFGDMGSYSQHSVLRDYGLALLKREGEYDSNYHTYLEHITELGKQFYQLQPEEWRTLDNIMPHVLYVGDTLAANYESDGKLAEFAYEFAYNTMNYVSRRMEMKRKHWLEMGLVLAQEKDDTEQQAAFLNSIGYIYNALGDKQLALTFYNQALPLRKQVRDKGGEAMTLNNIGLVYYSLGQIQEALKFFNQALPLRKEVGDKSGEARTLNNIGGVYSALGKKEEMLKFFNQILPLRKEVGDKLGEATTLRCIGEIYSALGDKEQTLQYYNQANQIFRQIGDKSGEAGTLNVIGAAYCSLGQMQEALRCFNQALFLKKEVGDKSGEASALNSIGGVYRSLGQMLEALKLHNQANQIFRQVGDKSGEAGTLNGIGGVYRSLGQMQESLRFFNQALSLIKEVGHKSGEATTLTNIGGVYGSLGQVLEALRFHNQANQIFRQIGDKSGEARTLNNIGAVYSALGDNEQALEYYNQALPLRNEVGDKSGEATTLTNIGLVYRSLGQMQEALKFYNQALPMLRQVGNKSVEATTLYNIASVYYKQNNLDEAIQYLEACVVLEEKIGHPDLADDRAYLEGWQQERDGGA